MSEHDSARIGLPYLAAGQMQKHVTLNETLTRLDALVQAQIQSATVSAEPAALTDGVLYLVPADSVGETWSGLSAGTLVRAEQGGWSVVEAPLGMIAYVADAQQLIVKGDEGWGSAGDCLRTLQQVERLGFRDHVDFALTDDDHFEIRVSADGDDWVSAMTVDCGTGLATFARGAQRRVVTAMSASGVYAPPSWARTIEIIAVGGGGGGGAGFFGVSGSRFGGGGGGAGGVSRGVWAAGEVGSSVSIAVGSGGVGGVGSFGAAGSGSAAYVAGASILIAPGGGGGAQGSSAGGAAGAGGAGVPNSNGGGASSVAANGAAGKSFDRPDAPGGGGAGGGLDAGATARSGGAGGDGGALAVKSTGGTAGVSASGGGGTSAPQPHLYWAGAGGGGGGANAAGAGHDGGAGGGAGGGGGGGGAGLTAGGAGGAGAPGLVWIIAAG